MIVIAVIGILAAGAVVLLNPGTQFAKAHNAQRKNDLEQIKTALDTYYSDYNHYPGQMSDLVSSYMAKLPKDPLSPSQDYSYEAPADGSWYRLYANLERCSDSQNTIGVDCLRVGKNYSINSSNLAALALLPTPTPTPTLIPTPTPTPTPLPYKRVFVSNQSYTGNLGGLSGADATCQALAGSAAPAPLGGTWMAWLSTISVSAASRLVHASLPYKLVDGTLIANNWTDLTTNKSGNYITNFINKDQNGNLVVGQYAWTNTKPDGSINYPISSSYTCSNWTSIGGNGFVGEISYIDVNWTQVLRNGGTYGTYALCTSSRYLYCFEQ